MKAVFFCIALAAIVCYNLVEVVMKRSELYDFVRRFNAIEYVDKKVISEGLAVLNQDEIKLLMLLVNFKNGEAFGKKLKDGEI